MGTVFAKRNFGVVIEYNEYETTVYWFHTLRDAKKVYKENRQKYNDVSLVKFIE